jgi:hypothetical protein
MAMVGTRRWRFRQQTGGGGQGWDGIANPQDLGGGGEVAAVFTISAPGTYTIRLSMREDASAIDALILQLQSLAAPTDGPAGVAPGRPVLDHHATAARRHDLHRPDRHLQRDGRWHRTITYQWQQRRPERRTSPMLPGLREPR